MHYKKFFVKIRYKPHLHLTRYHSVQESIINLKNLLKIMAIDFLTVFFYQNYSF